jgi:hypothetical protein
MDTNIYSIYIQIQGPAAGLELKNTVGDGGVVQAPHLHPVFVDGHAVNGGGVHHFGDMRSFQQLP